MIQEFFLLIAKKFQLTAARRRLADKSLGSFAINTFQLTAARRRLVDRVQRHNHIKLFQLTAARRRLEYYIRYLYQ